MRLPLALIAVAVAVAVAAAVVVAGMSSGNGDDGAGASPAASSPAALPSGHPSIAGDAEEETPAADGDEEAAAASSVKALEAKLAGDPGDVPTLLALADAYFMAQRLGEAEQTYSRALELEPDSPAPRVGLAMVWHAQGDSKKAESALRAVLKEHPDHQDAHYTLAIVCFSDGRVDEAREEWQTAADIDPGSTTGRRSQSFVDLLEDGRSDSPHSGE